MKKTEAGLSCVGVALATAGIVDLHKTKRFKWIPLGLFALAVNLLNLKISMRV